MGKRRPDSGISAGDTASVVETIGVLVGRGNEGSSWAVVVGASDRISVQFLDVNAQY
jgi:hypothetical protein